MPTYKNNSRGNIIMQNTNGEDVQVLPGETIETFKVYSNSGLTKISDAPLWNRVVNRQTITLSETEQDVAIDPLTDWIIILKITDNVTIYCQSITNTPPEYNAHTSSDPIIQIPASEMFDKLVMTGAGTCEVVEYRNKP